MAILEKHVGEICSQFELEDTSVIDFNESMYVSRI